MKRYLGSWTAGGSLVVNALILIQMGYPDHATGSLVFGILILLAAACTELWEGKGL